MATTSSKRKLLDRRKENNQCADCGKPLDREGYRCTQCNNRKNENHRLLNAWYKSGNICPRCGKNTIMGDENRCLECTARDYATAMRRRERLGKEYYNNQHSKWARDNYKKLAEQAICVRCGKRKAESGYKTCGICRAQLRNYRRIKYWKPKRSERYEQGLCYFCDEPIKVGYKVCEKHYQQCLEKLNNDKCLKAREEIKKQMKILYKSRKTAKS